MQENVQQEKTGETVRQSKMQTKQNQHRKTVKQNKSVNRNSIKNNNSTTKNTEHQKQQGKTTITI